VVSQITNATPRKVVLNRNAIFRVRHAMASRADQYRQLAQDCLRLAHEVPSGPPRDNLMDMAREWERLADEQDRATDLRRKD
jgi:hypothetical protein